MAFRQEGYVGSNATMIDCVPIRNAMWVANATLIDLRSDQERHVGSKRHAD